MTRSEDAPPMPLGVIEGFFGRDWGWPARHRAMGFFARHGFASYVYAPKSQRALRMAWRKPLDGADMDQLARLRAAAGQAGVAFGVGLTPFGFDPKDRAADTRHLQAKLAQIASLSPDLLCLLFDDTPGGAEGLAALHVALAQVVLAADVAPRLILCPAYYSDDPILDAVFGTRPPGYLETLGQALPAQVEMFWTGPKVVSEAYPPGHLEAVAQRMGRKPHLWDNGAVNDSRALSPYLPLDPVWAGVAPDLVAGRMVNPINQPSLAQLALAKLAQPGDESFAARAARLAGPDLGARLVADLPALAQTGFDGLGPQARFAMAARYAPFAGQPMADELLDWLAGWYVFDPACLT